MMLPIYEATILENGNVTGGTTLPCQMTVEDASGEVQGVFIVKVFGQQHIEQYNPTNKEIIANLLAHSKPLNAIKNILDDLNLDTTDFDDIQQYLEAIQKDSSEFQKLLIELVQI